MAKHMRGSARYGASHSARYRGRGRSRTHAPLGALLVLVGLLAACFCLMVVPYLQAGIGAHENTPMTLRERENGSLELSWDAVEGAERYLVELIKPTRNTRAPEELLWSCDAGETSCILPSDLQLARGAGVRITPYRHYRTLIWDRIRADSHPLYAVWAGRPEAVKPSVDIEPDDDIMTLDWTAAENCTYVLHWEEGDWSQEVEGSHIELTFGSGVLPSPRKDDHYSFSLYVTQEGDGFTFISDIPAAKIDVEGEEFQGTLLKLDVTEEGDNVYTLHWNETKGDRYEIQQLNEAGQWDTVESFTDPDTLTCSIGPLEPFTEYTFRVVALGEHTLAGSEFAATTAEITLTTGATSRYARIWVLQDLDIYSDSARSQVVARATMDKSYCVMGEEQGMFLIYYDGGKGYIDSNYCLINLPDYLGDMCAYNITNSYDAIYMVHDYGIPQITGTVITGYEEVGFNALPVPGKRTVRKGSQPVGDGSVTEVTVFGQDYQLVDKAVEIPTEFLVPLLYPVAKKVAQAAQTALSEGYRLKIYDTFRPWSATRFLYDRTETLLDMQVPVYVYSDMAGEAWDAYVDAVFPPEEAVSGGLQPPVIENAGGRMSIYTLMTNGKYSLGSFLARAGSMHNIGLAVDLTLERVDTGEELEMQTAMHDLSWYSTVSQNNSNANLLARIMTGCGLAPLSSEWWHFQDDEFHASVRDLVNRENGVTGACWIFDGEGWRYRTAAGEFLTNGVYDVNGWVYAFDSDGYSNYTAWEGTSCNFGQ